MDVEVDLMNHLGDLLASEDTMSLKTLMAEEQFNHLLEERANDIIPMVSYYLNNETLQNSPSIFRFSEKILKFCAEKGNAKECLMEFLAQIESLDEVKFKILLHPTQTTILRIPERKAPLMQCVFNVVHSFINSLALPNNHCLDQESKILLESDDKVRRIREHYHLIISFYEPFVAEITSNCDVNARISRLRLALLQALFHLLGHPLSFLDLEQNKQGPTSLGLLALKIVRMIKKLQNDPVQLLTLVENSDLISIEEERKLIKEFSSNEIKHSYLSMSVFFYVFFCEYDCVMIPYIYSKLFIFQNCLILASYLLHFKETLVLRKGLLLAKTTITMIEEDSVPFSYLAYDVHKKIIEILSNIAVYHDSEENRKLAIEIIKRHFSLFEPKAKFYILLRNDFSVKNPHLCGFFTTVLTSLIRETFTNDEFKPYFSGKRLFDLLNIYCSLKSGAETDLLENKSQILSALNLVIFLTKRDRDNVTGVWSYIPKLLMNFLKPLREAIDLSRAHFKQELMSLDDPQKKEEVAELAVTVGDQELARTSTSEKKEVIESGLTVFDLIDHVFGIANESVENKPNF